MFGTGTTGAVDEPLGAGAGEYNDAWVSNPARPELDAHLTSVSCYVEGFKLGLTGLPDATKS